MLFISNHNYIAMQRAEAPLMCVVVGTKRAGEPDASGAGGPMR